MEEEETRKVQRLHNKQVEVLEFINHQFLSFHKSVTNNTLDLELPQYSVGPFSNRGVEGKCLPKTPDNRIRNRYKEDNSDSRASPVLNDQMYDALKAISSSVNKNKHKVNLKSLSGSGSVLSSSPQNSLGSLDNWYLVPEPEYLGVQRPNFSNETLPPNLRQDYESKVIEFRRKKINVAKILALEWLTTLRNYNWTLQEAKLCVGLHRQYFLWWRNATQSRAQTDSANLSRPLMKRSRETDLSFHNQIRNIGQEFQYTPQNIFDTEARDYSPIIGDDIAPFDPVQGSLYREPSYDNFLSISENFDDIVTPPLDRKGQEGVSGNFPILKPSNIHEPFDYALTPVRSKNFSRTTHTRHSSNHSLSRKSSDTRVSSSTFHSISDNELSCIADFQKSSPREVNPLASKEQHNNPTDLSKLRALLASEPDRFKTSGQDRFKNHYDNGPTSTETSIHYDKNFNDIDCALSDLSLSDDLPERNPELFRLCSSDCKCFELHRLSILKRKYLQFWRQELQGREQRRLAKTSIFRSTTLRKDKEIFSRPPSPNEFASKRFSTSVHLPDGGSSRIRKHKVDQNERTPARDETSGSEQPVLYKNRSDATSPSYPFINTSRNYKAMPLVLKEKVSAPASNSLMIFEHMLLADQFRRSRLIKKTLDTWKKQSALYLNIRSCFNDLPMDLLDHIRPCTSSVLCDQICRLLYTNRRRSLEISFKKFRCPSLLERKCVEARHIMKVCSLKGAMDFWRRETKKKFKIKITTDHNHTVSLDLQSSHPEDPVYEKRLERKSTDFRKRMLLQRHFEAWRWIRAQNHSMLQSTQEIYIRNLVALSFDTWLRKSKKQESDRNNKMVEAARWGDRQAILRTFQSWLAYSRNHPH